MSFGAVIFTYLDLLLLELKLLLELARLLLACNGAVHVYGAFQVANVDVAETEEVVHVLLLCNLALGPIYNKNKIYYLNPPQK